MKKRKLAMKAWYDNDTTIELWNTGNDTYEALNNTGMTIFYPNKKNLTKSEGFRYLLTVNTAISSTLYNTKLLKFRNYEQLR